MIYLYLPYCFWKFKFSIRKILIKQISKKKKKCFYYYILLSSMQMSILITKCIIFYIYFNSFIRKRKFINYKISYFPFENLI